jgi:hypothetical protein
MYWGGLGGGLMGLMNSLVRNPARKQLTVFFSQLPRCTTVLLRVFVFFLRSGIPGEMEVLDRGRDAVDPGVPGFASRSFGS